MSLKLIAENLRQLLMYRQRDADQGTEVMRDPNYPSTYGVLYSALEAAHTEGMEEAATMVDHYSPIGAAAIRAMKRVQP